MARRRNIWEQIWEQSTEGPTVTVTIPRDHAESLLKVLSASLDEEMPGDDMDGDGDEIDDLNFGGDAELGPDYGDGGGDDTDMDLDLDAPAGDDDDEMFDEPSPPKKGPGRPPGAKNKKKAEPEDDSDDDKKDDGDDDKKDEGAGDFRPQTALGESSFSRLNRVLARPRKKS